MASLLVVVQFAAAPAFGLGIVGLCRAKAQRYKTQSNRSLIALWLDGQG